MRFSLFKKSGEDFNPNTEVDAWSFGSWNNKVDPWPIAENGKHISVMELLRGILHDPNS